MEKNKIKKINDTLLEDIFFKYNSINLVLNFKKLKKYKVCIETDMSPQSLVDIYKMRKFEYLGILLDLHVMTQAIQWWMIESSIGCLLINI